MQLVVNHNCTYISYLFHLGAITLYTDSIYVTKGINSYFITTDSLYVVKGIHSVFYTQIKVNYTVYSLTWISILYYDKNVALKRKSQTGFGAYFVYIVIYTMCTTVIYVVLTLVFGSLCFCLFISNMTFQFLTFGQN